MNDLVLCDARVVTPSGTIPRGWLAVTGERIAGLGDGEPPPAKAVVRLGGAWLGPGFIDVHLHGSYGVDTAVDDGDALRVLSRRLAQGGVTAFLAGVSTRSATETLAAVERITAAAGTGTGATLLGAYLEGPFLSRARRGAHPETQLRPVDPIEIEALVSTGGVRVVLLAPELPGADDAIRLLRARGITAIAGHTDATAAEFAAGVAAGVTAAGHVFNGMRGLHHREPGAVGAALTTDGVVCEVIADGVHVAPELLRLLWRLKGPEGIALITDSGAYAGLPDGRHRIHGEQLIVADGAGRRPDGTLTGSALPYAAHFRAFARACGVSFDELWPIAASTPARLAGVAERTGSIEIGKDADLVALDRSGSVRASVVRGRRMPFAEAAA